MSQAQCLCGPEERARRVLMVRRLHPAVTMQMLLQTFGVFGSVTGCKVFTHKSGRSAGCASLEFSNHQAACAALKGLQGSLLHGKHIMLQWFDQSLSSATSPVGPRGPGQRSELPAGALSEGGSCAAIAGRLLPSSNSGAGPVRSSAASCPGLSPFGLFAAAPPGAHPFCNSTAAMAAAAAAAAVAAQQQQQLQHPGDAAAATAAALLSGQHQLPPLVVQQLQRQVSAPLGPYGQLSPTASHIPPSPLTPGSHGGGWEALMSPVGPHCAGQQPFTPQHQQRDSAASSRGGADGQQQGWSMGGGHPGHSNAHLAAAAAKLSAAMASGSIPPGSADSLSMAASLQQLATMQQQALAYAAWQNQQQAAAAAALLQHQFSGQLPASSMLGAGSQHAQLHLLGARSMPSELGHSLSAEFLLQQASASLQQQQQQQQGLNSSEAGSSDRGTSAGAAGSLSRQHSTPAASGLLSAEAYASGAGLQQAGAESSSAGGADSIPAAGAAGSLDQASGGVRTRSPVSARRKSTGAPGSAAEGPTSSKPGAESVHLIAKKQLQWEDQRQAAGDQTGASGCGEGIAGPTGGGKAAGFGNNGADSGRATGRSSSHQLMSPLRGYSGSDDTANISPDVNALASALASTQQQAAAAAAAAAAVNGTHPAWLAAQQQVAPELLANQQQQNFLLAAAAAAAAGGSPSKSSGFSSSFAQQQSGQARSSRDHQPGRVSDSQVLAGARGGRDSSSYPQPGTLFSSPSLPGPSSVAAALDAMAVGGSDPPAWQQQRQAGSFSAEAPAASEAFKHKHKMHLQLPTEAANAAGKGSTSSKPGGSNGFEQLITTEVLPESPSVQQRHLHAASGHSPFGPHSTAAGVADTGSAWADWSASMAALLSPAHVSSLASRRFEDLITLQHGMAQEAAAAAAAQARLQQQGMDADAAAGAARLGSTSSQAAWLLQQGRAEQQQLGGGCMPAASRPGSLMTGAGSDMFGTAAGDSLSEGGVATALSKTRHNSLCLDSRPGLLTLSHMFQEAAAQQGAAAAAARPSPRGSRAASPQQQQQQHAAARRALPREAEAGGAGFGSFTFQPPLLRSLQASGLSAGSSISTNSQMICQPFQLPDFFSRDSRMGGTSPRGSVSTPGAAACASGAAAGAAAGRAEARGVGSPLQPTGIQHQYSENLNGTCIAEDSFSGGLDGTDRAPGSPCGPRHLQHSFSMPARFSAPGGAADALAAAAAAAVAANSQQQQQEGQRPEAGAGRGPYGDAFKTIWGPSPAG